MFEKAIILMLTALVGGLIGSYVSGYGHRRKNLWDLRFAAYQELIVVLHGMQVFYSGMSAHIAGKLDEGEKTARPDSAKFYAEYEVLRKSMVYGQLLYSTEVEQALNNLISFIFSEDMSSLDIDEYQGFNNACSSKVGQCLKFVAEQSTVDLELKPSLTSVASNFFEFIKS